MGNGNIVILCFFGCLLVMMCSGLPAKKDETDVELVPPVSSNGDQPIVDTGYFNAWGNPFTSDNFGGLFGNIESVMERMRQQIQTLLRRFPLTTTVGTSNSSIDSFPSFSSSFPKIGDFDSSKGNSSSITKIINGHKVVINETEYKNADDFGGTFFKVRIIDVAPESSELTTEKEAETVTENVKIKEEIDNSFENEIPKSKEDENKSIEDTIVQKSTNPASTTIIKDHQDQFAGIETFDEVDAIETLNDAASYTSNEIRNNPFSHSSTVITDNVNEILTDPVGSNGHSSPNRFIDTNAILDQEIQENIAPAQLPIDLSRDTYVNEILARNGAVIPNPDAEVFFVPYLNQNQIEDVRPLEKIVEQI